MNCKSIEDSPGKLFRKRAHIVYFRIFRTKLLQALGVSVLMGSASVLSQVPEDYYFDELPVVLSVT